MAEFEITQADNGSAEGFARRGRRTASRSRLWGLSATAAALLTLSAASAQARAATLSSSATLRFTKTHGSLIDADGRMSGTLTGSVSIHISFNSNSRMTGAFSGSFRGGNLSGRVGGEYYPSGSTTIYAGSATVSSGSGSYAHARAVGIHVSGTVNRSRRIVTITLTGHLNE